MVLDGSTFVVSDRVGDIAGAGADGYFHRDVRHLSTWTLLLDGSPLRPLTSRAVEYYAARIFATVDGGRVGRNPTVSVRRDRIVAGGVHEDVLIENHGPAEIALTLEVRLAADFADIFEIKDALAKGGKAWAELGPGSVTLRYEHGGFRRGTRVEFSAPGEVRADGAVFRAVIAPRSRWHTHIDVICIVGDDEHGPRHTCGTPGPLQPQMPLTLQQWLDAAPRLEASDHRLTQTYRRSLVDLAALRFRPLPDLTWSLAAAGLPWFMALFGRDSLITAYQALPFQARLAQTTLEALAAYQSEEDNPFRDAEPGKILHELRVGELASLGLVPHTPYYGTHDATPLFLVVLDEYERWTGDTDLVRELEPAARAALAWIRGPGDRDGDGYLEYATRSPLGLRNQGWKDSWNAIAFADGTIAEPPIALCEIQGYAYDARLRAARLAREVWQDPALATQLEHEAAALRARFDHDFWLPHRGHYALALDANKRPVDALTSNTGHLLWSGIVEPHRTAAIVDRLMAGDMFSGWGIRTMSTVDGAYNPIEYHNGTVWPHDTAIVAEGMRRYGFRDEASRLALALIDAAAHFDYRLPEVFAGFPRDETAIPIEYPTASSPQAWAAGAPLLALRTLLGMDPERRHLRDEPHLPASLGPVRLRGVTFRGRRRDVG